jgi:hypothetical protein
MVGIKVTLIESERGCGQRLDDCMICLSVNDANLFIEEFNKKNNLKETPDWYIYADSHTQPIDLTDKQYKHLKKKGREYLSAIKNL